MSDINYVTLPRVIYGEKRPELIRNLKLYCDHDLVDEDILLISDGPIESTKAELTNGISRFMNVNKLAFQPNTRITLPGSDKDVSLTASNFANYVIDVFYGLDDRIVKFNDLHKEAQVLTLLENIPELISNVFLGPLGSTNPLHLVVEKSEKFYPKDIPYLKESNDVKPKNDEEVKLKLKIRLKDMICRDVVRDHIKIEELIALKAPKPSNDKKAVSRRREEAETVQDCQLICTVTEEEEQKKKEKKEVDACVVEAPRARASPQASPQRRQRRMSPSQTRRTRSPTRTPSRASPIRTSRVSPVRSRVIAEDVLLGEALVDEALVDRAIVDEATERPSVRSNASRSPRTNSRVTTQRPRSSPVRISRVSPVRRSRASPCPTPESQLRSPTRVNSRVSPRSEIEEVEGIEDAFFESTAISSPMTDSNRVSVSPRRRSTASPVIDDELDFSVMSPRSPARTSRMSPSRTSPLVEQIRSDIDDIENILDTMSSNEGRSLSPDRRQRVGRRL